MFKGMDWNQVIIAILAIGILALSGYFVYSSKTQTESTMDISGTASMMVGPDKVEVYMTVETQNESAKVAEQENADIVQAVKSALADLGFRANDTETVSYYLSPMREYDRNGTVTFVGYKTEHSIKVTSLDINKAGAIVDAAVGAGINGVDNIVFGLTDSKRDQLKAQVINSSIDDARQKAEVQAARMGIKVVKVKHFSESSVYYAPLMYESVKAISYAPASTDISPGQIEVSASVSVTYQIE